VHFKGLSCPVLGFRTDNLIVTSNGYWLLLKMTFLMQVSVDIPVNKTSFNLLLSTELIY
jgi:hypothetical protein